MRSRVMMCSTNHDIKVFQHVSNLEVIRKFLSARILLTLLAQVGSEKFRKSIDLSLQRYEDQ